MRETILETWWCKIYKSSLLRNKVYFSANKLRTLQNKFKSTFFFPLAFPPLKNMHWEDDAWRFTREISKLTRWGLFVSSRINLHSADKSSRGFPSVHEVIHYRFNEKWCHVRACGVLEIDMTTVKSYLSRFECELSRINVALPLKFFVWSHVVENCFICEGRLWRLLSRDMCAYVCVCFVCVTCRLYTTDMYSNVIC